MNRTKSDGSDIFEIGSDWVISFQFSATRIHIQLVGEPPVQSSRIVALLIVESALSDSFNFLRRYTHNMNTPRENLYKFTVITPVRNSPKLLLETMESVKFQIGLGIDFEILHVIIDGDSSDNTIELVSAQIKNNESPFLKYILISEPDLGMYDAISKGFQLIDSGVACYQNAGDLYHPGAFSAVTELFSRIVSGWCYGRKVVYTENGTCSSDTVVIPYRKKLAQAGFYGFHKHSLGFFQQESLFFSSDLLKNFDLAKFRNFQLAGDFFLFLSLIEQSDGIFVNAILSGHRIHRGQLSEDLESYRLEMRTLIRRRSGGDIIRYLIDKLLSRGPNSLRRNLHSRILFWSQEAKLWIFRSES